MSKGIDRARRMLSGWVSALAVACVLATGAADSANAFTVSGQLHSYSSGAAVSGATIQLQGSTPAAVASDGGGQFAFPGLTQATWRVTAQKMGDAGTAITTFDAIVVLQAALGLRTLSPAQHVACDVSGNGSVGPFDAVLILQYLAGVIARFPAAQRCGSDWAFLPVAAPGGQIIEPQLTATSCQAGAFVFDPLTSDMAGQDFTAALFGDCSGSWQPTGGGVPTATATASPAATPTRTPTATPTGQPEQLQVQVLNVYPHDTSAFTEGLLLYNGTLYESTGLFGQSSLREVTLATGQVTRSVALAPALFGEGLARVDTQLIQLTWLDQVAFVYDLATFNGVGQFSYATQGWGLCYDGQHLVMSDGTPTLYVRDPATFQVQQQINVTVSGQPLSNLNELECVGGDVYANVWLTDTIVKIDKQSGKVTAVIDASGLLSAAERSQTDVLNGIAYNAQSDTFLITGKLWPKLFEVRFVSATP